jgi:NitT/TauT family transport system substrate-binding protein
MSIKALIVAGAVLGLLARPAGADTVVKQAGFKVVDLAIPFIAKAQGFFAKNGLDWRYVEISSGKLGIAALLSDNVQFVDLGMDDIAELQEQGKDPIGIYSMVNSLTMDLVVRSDVLAKAGVTPQSPLEARLHALKGMTFGITRPGAPTQQFVQYLMRKGGLDPEHDATFVQIGGGQALVSAVRAHRIDGFLLSAPAPYTLEADKTGTVLIRNSAGGGPPEFKDFAFETIAVRKAYAQEHPETVRAYCTALNEAYDWTMAHPDAAVDALQPFLADTDRATLKLSLDALLPALAPHGKLTKAAVANQLDVLEQIGAVTGKPSPDDGVLWTSKYCE